MPHTPNTVQRVNDIINNIFSTTLSKRLDVDQFMAVTTLICNLPSYMNNALFQRVLQYQANDKQSQVNDIATSDIITPTVSNSIFEDYMNNHLHTTDLSANLYTILNPTLLKNDDTTVQRHYLIRSDFDVYVNEIVTRHPGLEFLADTPDFQLKYSETVIARIFYQINVAGNERITMRELKQSNFLDIMKQLDVEDDINKLNDYYSYEHFYVLYWYVAVNTMTHNSILYYTVHIHIQYHTSTCLTTVPVLCIFIFK